MASLSDEDEEQTTQIQITEGLSTRVAQASIDDIVERQLVYVRGRRALVTCLDYPQVFWRYIFVENELEHARKFREQHMNSNNPGEKNESLSHGDKQFSSSFFYYHQQETDTSILLGQGEHHRSYGVKPLIFQIDPNDRLNIDSEQVNMYGDDDDDDDDVENDENEDDDDNNDIFSKYDHDNISDEIFFQNDLNGFVKNVADDNNSSDDDDPFMLLTRSPNTISKHQGVSSAGYYQSTETTTALAGTSPLAGTPILATEGVDFDADFDADFNDSFESKLKLGENEEAAHTDFNADFDVEFN